MLNKSITSGTHTTKCPASDDKLYDHTTHTWFLFFFFFKANAKDQCQGEVHTSCNHILFFMGIGKTVICCTVCRMQTRETKASNLLMKARHIFEITIKPLISGQRRWLLKAINGSQPKYY